MDIDWYYRNKTKKTQNKVNNPQIYSLSIIYYSVLISSYDLYVGWNKV